MKANNYLSETGFLRLRGGLLFSTFRNILLWASLALSAAPGAGFAALPVITSRVPDIAIYDGDTLRVIIRAYDPDHDSISYVLNSAPLGAAITDSIIRWSPTYADIGNDTIIYSVREHPSLLYVSDTFLVTVFYAGVQNSYTDYTSRTGLGDNGVTNALAWADYNNDGIADVYVANAGGVGALYKGSSGTFTLSSAYTGVSGAADAFSAAWADYNHDGRIDLFVANAGLFPGSIDRLYRNDTSGVFIDVTSTAGVGDPGVGRSATWVDFDSDGDPDIYVVNYGDKNQLYSNNGNGIFTARGDSAGIAITGYWSCAAWCDYDLDGKPDLYLVNESGANRLFKNDGDSTFTDITATAGVGHTGSGAAAAWGDYNNDGYFDLFLANSDSSQVLYSNNRSGTFTRMPNSGLAVKGKARSAVWIDFNMDGRLDLAVAFSDSANKLFQNNGDSTFTNVAPLIGMGNYGYWTSVTWADPTNQGVPDLYFGRRDGPNKYWNGRVQARYLKVRLHGVVSERFGTGARVRILAGGKRQVRWIDGGSGSMSEPAALFGLGSATVVDSLTVFWPSGLRRDTTNLTANNTLTWFETDSLFPHIDSTRIYPDTTFLAGPYLIDTWVRDNNLQTVYLKYSTNRGRSYSRVTATSQGSNGYRGSIPGQSTGTRVYYFFEAVDSVKQRTRMPYFAPDSFFDFSVDTTKPSIQTITLIPDTSNEQGPYTVNIRARDNDSLEVVYLTKAIYRDGILIQRDSTAMTYIDKDTLWYNFSSAISGQVMGTQVDYHVRAVDLAGNSVLYPSTAPDSTYSFRVGCFSDVKFTSFRIKRRGTGVAVSDYDLDGKPDIFLADLDTTDYLLKGMGDTLFSDVSAATVGTTVRASTGGYWGDYNNDGYPDLYLVVKGANVLLSNDKDGTFTDITAKASVGDAGQGWAGAWVDYNNDGLLDLFVVNNDGASRLYCNKGDSTFTDSAAAAGLAGGAGGVACAWADYDRDGDQDVYVVYYGASNHLYRNNGNGKFTDITAQTGVVGGTSNVSATWFDYNNDGLSDLYVVAQTGDILYRQNAGGTFTQVSLQSLGLAQQPGGFTAAWGDFDNDSYADLFKTRGESGLADLNALFRGRSDGNFDFFSYKSGILDIGEYRGAAWIDCNADGRMDLVLNNQSGQARLYRNINPWRTNHYLRVKLVGTRSSALGYGSRAKAYFGGKARMQELGSGTSFVSQSQPVLHFGLASSTTVDSLVVTWPSGIIQRQTGIAADQTILLTEIDTLYPDIVRFDTIPDQYATATGPRVTCKVIDRNAFLTAQVRYRTSLQSVFTTASMTRDSLSSAPGIVTTFWHYDMPALAVSTSNSWRIVAASVRGPVDSTALFTYSVGVDTLPPRISFISVPDALPDTSGPYRFQVRLVDQSGLSKAAFRLLGQKRSGTAVSAAKDTTFASQPRTLDWQITTPGFSLGTTFRFYVRAEDIQGRKDSLLSVNVLVGPRRGKSNLFPGPANVADLMRLVYIILGAVSQPKLVDTLGLDLDRDGDFNTDDLLELLTIWRGSVGGTQLMASAESKSPAVEAGLAESGEGIVFYLENQAVVPYGLVELENGNEKETLRIVPGARLAGLLHAEGKTRDGRYFLLFLPAEEGRGLSPGKGPLFKIAGGIIGNLSVSRVYLGGTEVNIAHERLGGAASLPGRLALEQNVPNPFNPSTTVRFALPASESGEGLFQTRLDIYNLRGALVHTLLNSSLPPGYYTVIWNGTDNTGKALSSGIYFYRLNVGNKVLTRKMILLK